MNGELQIFINEIVEGVVTKNNDFRFRLMRWSKDKPYWCVFVCVYIENLPYYGGHYCLETEANLHDILTILIDSRRQVEIVDGFFTDD